MSAIARRSLYFLMAVVSMVVGTPAKADVIVHGTRVIYPGNEREVTVRVENLGARPALVQTWIDDGDPSASPENAIVPFDMTPSLFRLEPGSSQSLRVIHTGEVLPQDRESLYWLNVLHIPPKANGEGRNLLQLRLRSRIKLIYRPAALARRGAVEAAGKLTWSLIKNPNGPGMALRADNPTPYYVNFANVGVKANGREFKHQGIDMAPPLSSRLFPLEDLTAKPGAVQIEFAYVTDQGATIPRTALLAP